MAIIQDEGSNRVKLSPKKGKFPFLMVSRYLTSHPSFLARIEKIKNVGNTDHKGDTFYTIYAGLP